MMREIKFRAWDDVEEQMVYVNYLSWKYPSGLEVNGKNVCLPETLMQYIGLKDKNGKEIYEGDILIGSEVYDVREDGTPEIDIYFVEWDDYNASFICRLSGETVGDNFECIDYSDLEVAGNIYEDKDRFED